MIWGRKKKRGLLSVFEISRKRTRRLLTELHHTCFLTIDLESMQCFSFRLALLV